MIQTLTNKEANDIARSFSIEFGKNFIGSSYLSKSTEKVGKIKKVYAHTDEEDTDYIAEITHGNTYSLAFLRHFEKELKLVK